jgi:hypothetical protein
MKEHSVEYMSMDHYMKSEKMKKKSAKMAEMGMTTCATPGKTNEEVQDREQEMRKGNMFFY